MRGTVRVGMTASLALSLSACYEATGNELCPSTTTEYADAVCVSFSGAGGLVEHRTLIEREVGEALDLIQPLIQVSNVRITVFDDPTQVVPEVGIGGFNPNEFEVFVFADAASPSLESILENELVGLLAHEMHHAMRRRSVGYGFTLLQGAVSEGLADHFSIEVTGGDPPPWSTALEDPALAEWTEELLRQGGNSYDHAEWFFGTGSIPRWTGYAVGYELVRAYLEANPGARASALVDEPAGSFDPEG